MNRIMNLSAVGATCLALLLLPFELHANAWPANCKNASPSLNNGKKHGPEWKCHPNGKWWFAREWKNGQPHGPSAMWHENGKKAVEGTQLDGVQQGLLRTWYPNGRPWRVDFYLHGKRNGLSRRWYPSGQLQVMATYQNGVLHGPHRGFHENGQVQFLGAWNKGKECGSFQAFDSDGKKMESKQHAKCPRFVPMPTRKLTPQATLQMIEIGKNAIKLNALYTLPESLYPHLKNAKAILIGGFHGTNETPALASGLISLLLRKGHQISLALEWSHKTQPQLDAFWKDGDTNHLRKSAFFHRSMRDGKASKAVIELLKKFRTLKAVSALCFAPEGIRTQQQRENAMASRILSAAKANPSRIIVVLSSFLNTRLKKGLWDMKNFESFGYQLAKPAPVGLGKKAVFAVRLRFGAGTGWICRTSFNSVRKGECRSRRLRSSSVAHRLARPWEHYFALEPGSTDGHHASFFVREMGASSPFR